MKKKYLSPRTKYVDLGFEGLVCINSIPQYDDGTDDPLTHKQNDIWNSWTEDK